MSLTSKIEYVWNKVYWDAMGCGEAEPEQCANRATADLRAQLARVERAQAPKLPRHPNLAGQRQAAARRAGL